jgi:hypothetical protein
MKRISRSIRMALVLAAMGVAMPGLGYAQDPPSSDTTAVNRQAEKSVDIPIRQVVLYSSGVGYFEHFGTVAGDGTAELRFKTEQINDILKSLVLQDLDGGMVSTITYPSQDPLSRTLKSFEVDITANPPLADLLNQLRGAKVTVSTVEPGTTSGIILGVEKKQKAAGDKAVVETHILNILCGGQIRSLDLGELRSVQLDDPKLQEELSAALAALAQARDQDKKPVTIHFTGQGNHRVRIGYVIETPVWKTSYRLILPSGDAKPHLQGWAIIDNQTDNDWTNVQLSLVSGRPISFIQDLYQPLYVPRQIVQPPQYANLQSRRYGEAMDRKDANRSRKAEGAGSASPQVAAPAPRAMESEDTMDATASVASSASTAEVGELFQYTVSNVSLARQRSAMIPIVSDDLQVQKLSIYNASVLPRNPLNGARLTNNTDKHLLAGPITVLEGGAYAGDAQIGNLPPGQNRLISYGIDLQMLVDSTHNTSNSSILSGKIVKGVLQINHKQVFQQDYVTENKSQKDKTLIIEHPIRPGWELTSTDKPVETTDSVYRFSQSIPAGQKATFTVQQQIVTGETLALLSADLNQLTYYSRNGAIPKEVRDVLIKAMELKQQLTDTQRRIDDTQRYLNETTTDQARTRQNLVNVPQNSDFYKQSLQKLGEQEKKIEQYQSDLQQLRQKQDQQRQELENFLNNASVG